ncbi:MAG: hypothetical protein H0T78_00955 [Longispora sp.]|nr:hypothetical protein [Longispora sp. (in: high G+C Gram-positive bacteria)]
MEQWPEGDLPEETSIDLTVGDQPSGGNSGTVAETKSVLLDLGVLEEDLAQLEGFGLDTLADQVPLELWLQILGFMTPNALASVIQLNPLFHELVRLGKVPVADAKDADMVHVYNAAQLTTAVERGAEKIVLHAGIEGPQVYAAPANIPRGLYLGPGVTVTGIAGGWVRVYNGATVTGITNGSVTIYNGGTASNISGGRIFVHDKGTANNISGRIMLVRNGGTANTVIGGKIYVWEGGKVQVPAVVVLHEREEENKAVFFTGDDEATSILTINLNDDGELVRE